MTLIRQLIIKFLLLWPIFLFSQVTQEANENAAINKITQDYVAAFNQHDATVLASFWAEDAKYINPITGAVVSTREGIRNELKNWMESAKVDKLEIHSTKIIFPEANTATLMGVFKLTYKDDKPPKQKAFKAELVKEQGKWLFKEVHQVDIEPADDEHYEHLKELEWMLGSWEDTSDDVEIKSKTAWWSQYKNYLLQTFSTKIFRENSLDVQQVIGWDPASKQIRSWIFDTDGGFGVGKWSKKGQNWYVNTSYTLPDGRKATAIHIYTIIDDNTYTWASEGRDIDGEIQPNIPPIKIVRMTSKNEGGS